MRPFPFARRVEDALTRIVSESLLPISLGLGFLYLVLAFSHPFVLPPTAKLQMSLVSLASAAVLLALAWVLHRFSIPPRAAYPLGTLLALLVLVNSAAILLLVAQPIQTTNFILLLIGLGSFLLSPAWLAANLLVVNVTWGLCVWALGWSWEWLHFAFAMFMATVLASLIFIVRRRSLWQLHALLIREKDREAELSRALAQTEEGLRLLASQAQDVIFRYRIRSPRGFDYVNPAIERLTGYTTAAFYQSRRLPLALLCPEDRTKIRSVLKCAETAQQPVTIRMRTRSGEERWVELKFTPVCDTAGRMVALEGIARDVTERKHTLDALCQAKERAEAASRIKSNILLAMSHEVRTPMTSILGYAELLAKELEGSPLRKQAVNIHQSGMRLLSLLNNVIDLAQVEAGRFEMTPVPHSLADTVGRIAALFHLPAVQKGIALNVRIEQDVVVHTDMQAEEHVLANVLHNAIRFTDQGSVTIAVRKADGAAYGLIEVADTGSGIAPDFLPHAFEEFRQESEGITRKHKGAGLGLAVARRIIEAMGGSIQIASQPAQGTTVTLLFPIEARPVTKRPLSVEPSAAKG